MCRCSPRCRWIKVLADLENYGNPFFYRHAGPNGPEESSIGKNARCAGDNPGHIVNLGILTQTIGIAGDRPPRYVISGGF